MTPDSLRYRLNDLGLTQKGAARLLEVNYRTMRRWCSGAQDIPEALQGRLDTVSDAEVVEAMRDSDGPRQWGLRADRWRAERQRGEG